MTPTVLVSLRHGLGRKEAMACGKAIINTDIHPGIGWVARHGQEAITVPALDNGALAAAIRRLQEEPEAATRLGKQGASRVSQLFNLDRFLHDTLAVYREVMAARTSL